MNEEKKYHIDGEAVTASELIERAEDLDEEYKESSLKMTSMAARILRENGFEVGQNR